MDGLATARTALEEAAEQLGMPKGAAVFLRMEFVGAIVAHHQTMKAAGLCDGAEFVVLDKAEAEAKVQEAQAVDLSDLGHTTRNVYRREVNPSLLEAVELCCNLCPEKVNPKNSNVSCRFSLLLLIHGLAWVGRIWSHRTASPQ